MDQRDFKVFFTSSEWILNLLQEIGRLREIFFEKWVKDRSENDLDRYDVFYRHLILWDNHKRKLQEPTESVLGGIISAYGINGFYIASLFHIDTSVAPLLEKTIEMGRAFVVKEY